MRTRIELEEFLNSVPVEIIGSTDSSDNSYIFDTQIQAAKDVIVNLACNELRTNHVILLAKMQSGKTGTCNAITNLVMNTSLKEELCVNKVLYMTGMNDCGLANQTYDRVIEQVTGATQNNTIDKFKKKTLPSSENIQYFVLKNNNLRSFKDTLNCSLIFIDESHFGSKELNVLTNFMKSKGVDWKNRNSLIENNIYIVSVSATPFDEIVSDVVDSKPMVQLYTDENYVGVSEYFERGMIFPATKNDFATGSVMDYLKDAYDRMVENHEKGVVIIRTRDFEFFHNDKFASTTFNIYDMDASGSKIDYDNLDILVNNLIADNDKTNKIDFIRRGKNIPATLNEYSKETVRPVLVLIKGAFRAGITIKPKIKDLIYMVYDFSTDANATAQALLGRMCGYRDLEHCSFNTRLYVNVKFAQMYADWEKNFTNKQLIPSSRTKWVWVDNSYQGMDTKIGSKSCGNFTIELFPDELREICQLSQCSERICNKRTEELVKKIFVHHHIEIKYDYFFEVFMKGKNNYAQSTQEKRFNAFSPDSNICQFRPEKSLKFRQDTGRDVLNKSDLGKKGISIVFDSTIETIKNKGIVIGGNRRLLVYYFEVAQQKQMANHESLYCMHKDTSLLN